MAHGLTSLQINLHGGEPLLVGVKTLVGYVAAVREAVGARCRVDASVQTNGTLLTEDRVRRLADAGIGVGVSVDGGNPWLNRHRVNHAGRSSWAAVSAGLEVLRRHPEAYAGILSVIDPDSDPVEVYTSLAALGPPSMDLLLPHANWAHPPAGTGPHPYADWLIQVFDLWFDSTGQLVPIRLFREIIGLLLGLDGGAEAVGNSPMVAVVVDTDGAIEQVDSLKTAYEGAPATGRDVFRHSFDDVLDHPGVVARQLGRRALSDDIGIQISPDYPIGFQTSWAITLDSLERENPRTAELLRLFALFSPGSIPVGQLQRARPGDLPPHLAELATDPVRWQLALTRISESTAVRMDYARSSAGSTDSVSAVESAEMHRLYHRFLRRTLSPADRTALSAVACRVLVSADPKRPWDKPTWPTYAALLPHLSPSGALESPEDPVRELVLRCIEYLRLQEDASAGLTLCEQVLARWRGRLTPTHPSMLILVHQQANMLRRCGRYREAEAVGRSVAEQLAYEREPDDADLLRAKTGLGGSLMALGRFGEAHQLFDQVWRAYDALEGPEVPRTLSSLHNLGVALGLLGRYSEATSVRHQLLVQRERLLPTNHPLTLFSALTYARALRLQGRHEEAIELQDANTELYLRTMGKYHAQTLDALHNQALCLLRSGDVPAAGDLLRDLVERCRQLQGARHPMTLMIKSDLASFLRSYGDPAESAPLVELVAADYRNLLGDDHPNTVGAQGNRGLTQWRLGDHDAAGGRIEQALRGMRATVGGAHPWTLGCALNTAAVQHLSGRREDAAALREDTLRRARQVVDEGHPLLLACAEALTTAADDPPGWNFEPQPI